MTHSYSYPLPFYEVTQVLFANKKRRALVISNDSNKPLIIWFGGPKRFKSLLSSYWVRTHIANKSKTGKFLRWLLKWEVGLEIRPEGSFELNIYLGDVWTVGEGRGNIVLTESDKTVEVYYN